MIIPLISLITISCHSKKEQQKKGTVDNLTEGIFPKTIDHTIETSSGMVFTLTEEKLSHSVSNILIQGVNFPNSMEIISTNETDPIEQFNVMDLNDDGFEEVYITQRSAGSGSYAKIIGVTSMSDNSYGEIIVPPITDHDDLSVGYMGHDEIEFVKNNIIRTYPIYKDSDSNAKPTGGQRKVQYELITGEAGYILNPYELQM
ncbi:hypothetical protein NH26_12650 [Flammeovirga pacifica]|uniref:Uncharacterized protein n=1 Tax=Flammeovirga pacifica TaxID=915059 RepID=A0A1S1Z1L4_FLAPC|nr:hypothetical protein NH26_12650 [Flammeovirga pacifica]